jgi:membrane protein YqaA with SNARE-associated domain
MSSGIENSCKGIKLLQKLYTWTFSLAKHPKAIRWLAFISFIESSVFPIPPDVILLPMVLANRTKAFFYAGVCTISSVLGGFLGYSIGYFLWEKIGSQIFEFYGYMDEFNTFQGNFLEYGVWLVFIFGLTFFPFKVITIASGVTMLDPIAFGLISLLSRSLRFFIEATLLWKFEEPIQKFIERRLTLVTTIFILLGILGFIGIKYIGA